MESVIFISILVLSAVIGNKLEFEEHLDRVHKFDCAEPQPRWIPVPSLSQTLSPDERYYPTGTVLHRCDEGTGACREGEQFSCAVSEFDEVDVVFSVERISNTLGRRSNRRATKSFVKMTVVNHTQCGCQMLLDRPK